MVVLRTQLYTKLLTGGEQVPTWSSVHRVLRVQTHYIPSTSAWDEISDFSATENYQAGDIVLSGGQFLQANSNLSPGALNPTDWSDVTSAINDLSDVGSQAILLTTFGPKQTCLPQIPLIGKKLPMQTGETISILNIGRKLHQK